MLDVAIIGGGVSGCYCAYRLAHDTHSETKVAEIELFEAGPRLGGRLYSKRAAGVLGAPMEFGGMYHADTQLNVSGLIKKLGLTPVEISAHKDVDFLRGHYLQASDYKIPRKVPYFVDAKEAGKHPIQILTGIIESEITGLRAKWPLGRKPKVSKREAAEFLRAFQWRGRPLHDWGFWNFLAAAASNEAYELVLATSPSAATLRNANAYDTIWTLLHELEPQVLCLLEEGYQKLPEELLAQSGVRASLAHHLTRIDKLGGAGYALHFDGKAKPIEARKIILALPRAALEAIAFGDGVLAQSFISDELASVLQVPACKLFLVYEDPWWVNANQTCCATGADNAALGGLRISSTDLPMRLCFFFGAPKKGEKAVILATYADDIAASFWKGLRSPDYCRVSELIASEDDILCAPDAMIDAAERQLRAMHPAPVEVTKAVDAAFCDWSEPPFGAAWHAWKAYKKSWEIAKRVRRPDPAQHLYICGEAYAAPPQGWVEGAINSAEAMLEAHFKLGRPAWVSDSAYEFQIDGTT